MKSDGRSPFAKTFFLIFLPLFLLFSIVSAVFFFQEMRSQKLLLKSKERQHVETLRRVASDDFKTIISDLFLLSVHPVLHQLIMEDNPGTRPGRKTPQAHDPIRHTGS